MAYWLEYPGAPAVLEEIDYRMTWRGDSPAPRRVYAPPQRPVVWEEQPLRIARPWAPTPTEPPTREERLAGMDEWCARERRPLLPIDHPTRSRRGKRRGGGCAETGLRFRAARWT